MGNIRVNSCENLNKRGILNTQQIKESYDQFKSGLCESDKKYFAELLKEKDETIAGLYKEIDRLTVENNRLIVLHNESGSTNEIITEDTFTEADEFLYSPEADAWTKAYEEENRVIM